MMVKPGYHDCGVNGHTAKVKNGILFCRFHWSKVTRPTQRAVYAAWDALKQDDNLLTLQAYRTVVEQAKAEAEGKAA